MTQLSGHNFIGGERSAEGQTRWNSVNACTGEDLPFQFHEATEKEVNAAAEAAADAYPAFRALSSIRRAEFLDAIASELEELGDDFLDVVTSETALPRPRIVGERVRTASQLRLFATVLRRGDFYGARIDLALPDRQPLPRPDIRQYKIGVGPVAVFGASNFPLAFSTAGGDTAAALAAGCPVVFKAHRGHMATSEYVATAVIKAAEKTSMPKGVFNMIYGSSVGAQLVKHPAIQAVGFTGSLAGGRALCDMAAARPQPIPVFAEMSSINPVIILPAALASNGDKIAADLAASVAMGAGQFCTNPGMVLGMAGDDFTAFAKKLGQAICSQPSQTMLSSGGLKSYQGGLDRLQRHSGVTHLAGEPGVGNSANAQLFQADAALLLDNDALLQEEVFGPCTVMVEANGVPQLKALLHALRGQLTATLIAEAQDQPLLEALTPILETKVGRILVNGYPTGVEVCDAMVHGGPYPATSDARGTSVGTLSIERFLRPVCYQNYPESLLPDALKNSNPLKIIRLVNGELSDRPTH
ncbi:aldehyde dehydrogenase (NADP(+)) [Pantoea sp. Ap-967]|uniref:aldehyde dehydrogenase (NADP(+)) n=1 Tax=Pantoea sp. Ap-967 TaxID=2608362 RepID=UPI001423A372|nr:aldehyde dehydrogenase (NADP(+)) [Pantoea sp. Ap-967]NIE73317.1 aldehyde dehydrogenase (NADP(+)) [Pantoea sp. Ap-967]